MERPERCLPDQPPHPRSRPEAPERRAGLDEALPKPRNDPAPSFTARPVTFPFSAIVGQDEMRRALMIAAVDPSVGGVLVFGDRGTGKSTAIRGLAALLPPMKAVIGCPYSCDPAKAAGECPHCSGRTDARRSHLAPVPVVDLPLGATEDRVVGALDLERALTRGEKAFEPGLLARANRGFLYIDEVNLLARSPRRSPPRRGGLRDQHRGARGVERPGTRRGSFWWAAATRRRGSCGPSSSTGSASPWR